MPISTWMRPSSPQPFPPGLPNLFPHRHAERGGHDHHLPKVIRNIPYHNPFSDVIVTMATPFSLLIVVGGECGPGLLGK